MSEVVRVSYRGPQQLLSQLTEIHNQSVQWPGHCGSI